ncbi:MAG: sigma-70 family RNA polymerase sigma factor [Pelagibacterales bacterium]|nr:sigma-70 family RNA polymerase sigma factor [Pelagibacterales bacterium]
MKEKLDENFIKSLVVIALGIVRGKSDPYELVNGAVEYLISNKEKYMDHPNLKAVAVLKMKGLFIDEIRKTKKFTSMTDEEGKDLEIADEKQTDISDKIHLRFESRKMLSIIYNMGEKCREILNLSLDHLSYKEMAEILDTPIGTVMSRLANCKKELKGLMA